MLIVIPLDFPVGSRRDDRLGRFSFLPARLFNVLDERLAVVAFVRNHRLKLQAFQQNRSLGHVRRLPRRQSNPDGISQGIDRDVGFGAKSPAASSKGFSVLTPFFPAAC